MRRLHRAVMLAAFVAVTPVLAGCADFDPDKLDVFGLNEKKKIPGDRRPLFPEGVPGVSQGIPPEFLKGNEAQQTGAAVDNSLPPSQQTATAEPAADAKLETKSESKPEAKAKPRAARPRQAARAPAQVRVQPTSQSPSAAQAQQPAAAPWPEPAQAPPQQAQSPWPAASQANSTAPWPSAPPPGTFSKQ